MIETWDTSCLDWETRIVARQSLIPVVPVDEERAAKALRMFKRLRLVDVPGKPTMGEACEQWVFDFVWVIFGARNAETKRQIIREFFLLIAKKNGKSSIAAGIMLIALILNERAMGEYLILAPTKDVADNSFIPAYGMVKEDPALLRRYKPSDTTREIVDRLDGSTLAVKSADADVVGGQKSIATFVDELWLFGKKAAAENILSEATGSLAARPEGFVIYASTQSDEPPAGVFKAKLDYHRSVRDGKITDRTSLPLIYEYPPALVKAEAWRTAETRYIPNPSLGRSVDEEWLATELSKKQAEGQKPLRLFLTKHFNIEAGANLRNDGWPGAASWEQRADPAITFQEILRRCEAVAIGVDGGGLDDLFGLNVLGREREPVEMDVEEMVDGELVRLRKPVKRWLSWSHAWCHKGVLERRVSIASVLQDFEKAGELTIVGDELSDISQIVNYVKQVRDAGLLTKVAVDPAGIGEFVDALADPEINVTVENETLLGAPQGIGMMNAIKTAERKLTNGTLLHAPSGLMMWSVNNLKIEPMATAIRATKQNAGDAKIDPVMAMFDAIIVMEKNPAPASVYETRGVLVL